MRSGPLPTPLVVGLGAACRLIVEERENDVRHVQKLSKYLFDQVSKPLPSILSYFLSVSPCFVLSTVACMRPVVAFLLCAVCCADYEAHSARASERRSRSPLLGQPQLLIRFRRGYAFLPRLLLAIYYRASCRVELVLVSFFHFTVQSCLSMLFLTVFHR